MLTNLVKVTQDLLSVAIILGLLLAFAKTSFRKTGKRIMITGVIAGLAASVFMAVLNNTSNLIETRMWNLRMLTISIVAFVVFAIFVSRIQKEKEKNIGGIVACIAVAALAFAAIGYAFPSVWGYPFSFTTADESVLSTDFLYKLIGYLFGFILAFLTGLSVYQGGRRLKKGQLTVVLWAALIVDVIRQLMWLIKVMMERQMIKSNHFIFLIVKFANNRQMLFLLLIIIIGAIAAVLLWLNSFRQQDPYRNPAEHRKVRAKWRRIRRWATTIIATAALGIVVLTAINAFNNREVELSPVEDAKVADGNVYVTFEQVEDGHLHRFAYVTEEGTQIRFIVIKKPNSSSYGIGLDACDICGETGYYEKDGQVVCKLCDVVMNVQTIGFKGGCNPIVIDYTIENGQIVVPIEGLLEYEDEFK